MKTKIDIISGFLGAGKTTFIKKLISEEYTNEKIVVVENEFGRVNIDSTILKNSGIIVEEITSGCICCSLAGDFIDSVIKVMTRFNPDRIIIEPTGVAKLSEILSSLRDKKYSDMIELNNVITIVDIKRLKLSLSYSKEFIDDQIKATKSVVLSKTSGIDEKNLQEAVDCIKNINSRANIVTLQWDRVTSRQLLNSVENINDNNPSDRRKIISARIHHHPHHDESEFTTLEIETNSNFERETIKNIFSTLENGNTYGNIVRGKGIFKTSDTQYLKFDYVPGEIIFENSSSQK